MCLSLWRRGYAHARRTTTTRLPLILVFLWRSLFSLCFLSVLFCQRKIRIRCLVKLACFAGSILWPAHTRRKTCNPLSVLCARHKYLTSGTVKVPSGGPRASRHTNGRKTCPNRNVGSATINDEHLAACGVEPFLCVLLKRTGGSLRLNFLLAGVCVTT